MKLIDWVVYAGVGFVAALTVAVLIGATFVLFTGPKIDPPKPTPAVIIDVDCQDGEVPLVLLLPAL